MKKGISYWSFEADLRSANPAYADVFRLAKRAGFDAVEASVSSAPASILRFCASAADIKAVRSAAAASGMTISSVASGEYWGVSLTDPDRSRRAQAVANVRNQLRIAAELGCSYILVVPGAVQPQFMPATAPVPYDECWKRAVDEIGKCVRTAEQLQVTIGIENVWNRFLLSPLEMRAFCETFDSDRVKAYLDVGNVMFNGFPQDWIRILGAKGTKDGRRYLCALHIKDFRTHFFLGRERGKLAKVRQACQTIARGAAWAGAYAFCDIGQGDVPAAAVMAALKHVGFDGYLTAEMLPPYAGVIARTGKALDRFMGEGR